MDNYALKIATDSRHWEERKGQLDDYVSVLRQNVGDLKGKRLLDVGCATGIDVDSFRKLGLVAEGVDIRAEFIAEAQEKYPGLRFTVGDAEDLPFKDSTFDIVFSINTLFYTDIKKSVKEFVRVLKHGGYLIFSFDLLITDLDKDKAFHSENGLHLEEAVSACDAKIVYLGEEMKRVDVKPFRHEHTYKIVLIHKP